MKKIISGCVACVLLTASAAGLSACGGEKADREGPKFDSPDVEISAEVKGEGTRISDRLFGIFLEDINYASYLMDDNLISNGSFEYDTPLKGWEAVNGAQLTMRDENGVSSSNKKYLRVSANANGGLQNGGYNACKMAVTEGKNYNFSAFVRGSYEGNLVVRIADGQKIYAEKKIAVKQSGEWVKYKTALTANASVSANLCCQILLESSGEIDLDAVSLETEESTVGIKNYAYEALRDLSPKFIRFPGGCVIEGKSADSAYDWKNSIGVDGTGKAAVLTYKEMTDGVEQTVTTTGEPCTRTPNTDIWQVGNEYYDMEYAIGFYEYFMLCDSLGASAIPIVNCGISCMIQTNGAGNYVLLPGRNGNGVNDYIQDALDLVAFAKGNVNSSDANEAYWAKVRTDMGHAEPFDMTYLGIGNEQWGTAYYGYYEKFAEAFQTAKAQNNALYGEIQLIVGNGVSINDVEKNGQGGTAKTAAKEYRTKGKITSLSEYGVQDHHYYMNYSDFFGYTTLYDSYTRGGAEGYDVFVGEYSANDVSNPYFPTEKNSWITALSEAAYMTGLERNGDVVKLAAYAPVFGNADQVYNQWQVDMMYYTNTRLIRSANYYVQQLFAQNAGSRVYTSEVDFASGFEKQLKLGNNVRIDKIYQVIGKDDETGDIIVKIVNAGREDVTVNVDLSGVKMTGIAHVTELQNDDVTAVNSLSKEKVTPEKYTLGVKSTFGYTARKNSVTAIRVHTK